MRAKYESLSVAVLKDLAKSRGIKSISTMKKNELIEAMLAVDAREEQNRQESSAKQDDSAEKPRERVVRVREDRRRTADATEAREYSGENGKENSKENTNTREKETNHPKNPLATVSDDLAEGTYFLRMHQISDSKDVFI